MHFFNPAPLMPLVEIVRAELTVGRDGRGRLAVGERLGKDVVRCHDTPGFVVNRVLIPLLNDCLRVLDEARVTPEALDTAMKNGAGWPMGPCALVDLVGIDVHVHAVRGAVREAARAAHGAAAAARRDEERRPARPQERPRLLHLRRERVTGRVVDSGSLRASTRRTGGTSERRQDRHADDDREHLARRSRRPRCRCRRR